MNYIVKTAEKVEGPFSDKETADNVAETHGGVVEESEHSSMQNPNMEDGVA